MAVSGDGSVSTTVTAATAIVPSLPPPCPKSPPEYPDLYGKRREMAKVVLLEREIGFLQEELKSVEGLQPSSRSCKELLDFVVANADPLIPTYKKKRGSYRFWNWLCKSSCFSCSWICCCCCTGCSLELEIPPCCDCQSCSCPSCNICCCPLPRFINCGCLPTSSSCSRKSICYTNCKCRTPSCLTCSSCFSRKCSCRRCPKSRDCCKCRNWCFNPCCCLC